MQIVLTADEVHAEACAFVSSMTKAMLCTRSLRSVRLKRWSSAATAPDLLLEVPLSKKFND